LRLDAPGNNGQRAYSAQWALIAFRDPARADFGHLKIVPDSSRAQAFHDARPILYLTVLAHRDQLGQQKPVQQKA
jgi:hypothetical protein